MENKKILVVEDDEYLLDAYKTELEANQFSVDIARDGTEALEYLKNKKPDLIIVDLIMPKMGGIELLKELSKQNLLQTIPVIVATNVENEESKEEIFALGVKDYFIKSDISLDKFSEICRKNLA